jgi:FkbM family methyltransferase
MSSRYLKYLKHLASKGKQLLDIQSSFVSRARRSTAEVHYGGNRYVFGAPNWLCRFRADTFADKEPETLRWIDSFPADAVMWDLGANIGLYSIYAAKTRGTRVIAFEPSVFNLEFLARNIGLNGLTDKICIAPIAVGERTGTGLLHMSSLEWGGALSTFDKTYGYDGKELKQVFEYATLSVSLDDVVGKLGLPAPDFLKIDVDGIEHLILAGGPETLRKVKGVLIEISTGFAEQAERATKYLTDAGLYLAESHLDNLASGASSSANATVNQIWKRA